MAMTDNISVGVAESTLKLGIRPLLPASWAESCKRACGVLLARYNTCQAVDLNCVVRGVTGLLPFGAQLQESLLRHSRLAFLDLSPKPGWELARQALDIGGAGATLSAKSVFWAELGWKRA